jgi:hypothetical protein
MSATTASLSEANPAAAIALAEANSSGISNPV